MGRSQGHDAFIHRSKLNVKSCPWCGGALTYDARYPVRKLIPGDARSAVDDTVPEPLRTRPAWSCQTPHCRFREPA